MPRKRAGAAAKSQAQVLGNHYLMLLAMLLAGYAVFGKGFAALGFAPFYVGEVVLLIGAVLAVRSGLVLGCLSTVPASLLAVLMSLGIIRTLPFIADHGMDALRDSVVVMYGAFAFIVIALLLQDGRRLDVIVQSYGRFIRVFVPVMPLLFAAQYYFREWLPNMPGTEVPIVFLGPGEVPVHLAGAAVFALTGLFRPSRVWIVALVAALAMASALTRGGMLAFLVPVLIATVLVGRTRQIVKVAAIGAAIFLAAYAVERGVTDHREIANSTERQLSPAQLVENVKSIFGHSDPKLEGSRQWRLDWWDIILRDTLLGGPNFWAGRGFGLNIAVSDGIEGEHQESPLRSPHNAFMTILARMGVLGMVVWLLFLGSWLAMMTGAFFEARRRLERGWTGLFLFTGCYATASLINASFDVALEGPMQGVWFWSLIGLGIGSVMIFRFKIAQPQPERRR